MSSWRNETASERIRAARLASERARSLLDPDCRRCCELGRACRVHAARSGSFKIKCDDCKTEIGKTDSIAVSAQGGRCDDCRKAVA